MRELAPVDGSRDMPSRSTDSPKPNALLPPARMRLVAVSCRAKYAARRRGCAREHDPTGVDACLATGCCSRACNVSATVTKSTLQPSAAARALAHAAKSAMRRCSNTCPRWPAADAQHVPDQSHAVRVIHLGMVVRAGGGLLRVICAFLPLMMCHVDCS